MFIMSFNLIESVKEVLSGDMTNKMAGMLGESHANVQQAMTGAIPSILTGIVLKADSGNVQDTLNLATDAARIDVPFDPGSLSGAGSSPKGMDFLKNIFGEKTSALSDSIASYSGVSNQSATSLLTITAPAALGVLGKHILDSNMNASGLASFLNGQRKKIFHAMPASIFLEGVLGIENLTGIPEKFLGNEQVIREPRKGPKWILPVIIILAAIAVAWYFINQQKEVAISDPVPPITGSASVRSDTLKVSAPAANESEIKLPNGEKLNAMKGGIENQLLIFLNDVNSKPSRRFLFNFDQLNFNTGTAVITSESMVQIQNVAAILNAYPKTKIKIGGFTDRSGDSTANQDLSARRAASVAAALKTAGANPKQILGTEGFGSEFAKYPEEAADSLRQADRHISVSVRSK
jgi:outer membrane protein OmpA-like peptidoglycan-associated protein